MKSIRRGFTLIEVLIVIAIVAVLFGLLMGAIQKIRFVASGLEDKNKLQQIMLATLQYANQQNGKIAAASGDTFMRDERDNPHYALLPYLSSGQPPYFKNTDSGLRWDPVPVFTSNNDLSLRPPVYPVGGFIGPVSFAYSAPAFSNRAKIPDSFPDGTSQTISFAEHFCQTWDRYNTLRIDTCLTAPHLERNLTSLRNGSFADPGFEDWGTEIPGSPAFQNRGQPIQYKSTILQSDGRRLQALQSTGLKVGMMDGSVRVLGPAISPDSFWALVTPRGGEIIND